MTTKSSRLAYLFLLLSLLIRLAYVHFINPVDKLIFSDMGNYVSVAEMIMRDEWRITHFFQPIGLPLVILTLKSLTPHWTNLLGLIQIILGTATLWFVWKISKETFGEKVGLWSLAIASLHLPWITFIGFALSESIYIFFLSVLAWLTLKLIRTPSVLICICWTFIFFLAFLMKGTHVFYGPLFVIALFMFRKSQSFKYIISIGCVMGLFLIGHGLYAQAKVGRFLMSANAGGLNFVEGKCPLKNNADNSGYSWLSPLYFQLDMHDKKQWDRPFSDSAFFMKEGFKCIINNPFVLIQSLENIPFLFMGNTLWPANQTRIANEVRLYELFFACFAITGLIMFFRFLSPGINREEVILAWILPILSIFLCVYVFKSEIRFRVPFDVWIIPVAVKGWANIFRAKIMS